MVAWSSVATWVLESLSLDSWDWKRFRLKIMVKKTPSTSVCSGVTTMAKLASIMSGSSSELLCSYKLMLNILKTTFPSANSLDSISLPFLHFEMKENTTE
jgi:hypothetical protein